MPKSERQKRIAALRLECMKRGKVLGYTHAEIAEAMKTTQSNVTITLHRARHRGG